MAEAVVEDRPQQPQRFYCHMCSVEIHMVTSDYTCPICAGGFIEELPAVSESSSSEDVEMTEPNGTDNLEMFRNELRSLLMSRGGTTRPAENDHTESEEHSAPTGSRGYAFGRRNPRHHRMANSDNILYEILQALSMGNDGAFGNASMFFMGNPGDYAWGHEGLDTIVTQLLNQMDTTGPPPLSKEKIEEIPNVEITQEQVDMKLQCSVCWEDFKLSESVRKLPCLHVYHENCIVPWLQLHGTCPICRKSLSPENADVTNSLRSAASAFIRSSSEDSGATSSGANNGISSQTNTSSSQPDLQLPEHDNILNLNSIPLTFSRIFAQPGMSAIITAPRATPLMHTPTAGLVMENPNDFIRNNLRVDGGGGGGGGGTNDRNTAAGGSSSNSSSNADNNRRNNSSQNDIHVYEDGNVDFDFD